MQSIFGTDGIRGRFNEELTYSLAYKVGYALGSTLEKKSPILIGRDTRISGDILLQAITQGISESGKKFLNKSNETITIDMIKINTVLKFDFKFCSLLSDCTIEVLLTKNILNKFNK